MAFITALLSCLYVSYYNRVGELIQHGREREGWGGLFSLPEHVAGWACYAYIFPVAGLVLGKLFQKRHNEVGVISTSAVMVICALAWVFVAILAWQIQNVPHAD